MSATNPLALASVSDIKALVSSGTVTHEDAIARVAAVLSRKSLTDVKKNRWTRLHAWLLENSLKVAA